jgi:hypothetical protein
MQTVNHASGESPARCFRLPGCGTATALDTRRSATIYTRPSARQTAQNGAEEEGGAAVLGSLIFPLQVFALIQSQSGDRTLTTGEAENTRSFAHDRAVSSF